MTAPSRDRTMVSIYKGAIYIIRDNPEWMNGSDLPRCQYAAPAVVRTDVDLNAWDIDWKPCGEGTAFDVIEPFLKLADAAGIAHAWTGSAS